LPKGFEIDEVWMSRGRGFQMGVVQGDGVVIHLTGQVAWSTDERIVGKDDIEAQTRQIFENIRKLLEKAGGDLSDIVSITTYFTDRAQLPLIQKKFARNMSLRVRNRLQPRLWLQGLGTKIS
jgi:2-iminobutanoate/2-iminopropanoate deaminase